MLLELENKNQGIVAFRMTGIELIFDPTGKPVEVSQHVWETYLKPSGLFRLVEGGEDNDS